jgi:hypothetical protein
MMRRISSNCVLLLIFLTCLGPAPLYAGAPTSYRQAHPLNWAHSTPVGETPGWEGDVWTFFEVSNGNVWNAPMRMIDKRNGRNYEYEADFEQASAILELGGAITESLALSLEIPFAYRGGGFLDNFIDGFHVFTGNRRFNRQFYEEDQAYYSVSTQGLRYYESEKHALSGVSNLKPKLKWWIWKNEGSPGQCPCGLAVSAQVKVPIQDVKYGGTTGNEDYSGLLHFGFPIGDASALWFTGAYTRLSNDPAMKDWPLLKDHQMYELSLDLALDDGWGVVLVSRMDSPYLDRKHLEYYNSSSDPDVVARDRAASGWNSLVYWQGTQAAGLRYRSGADMQFNFLFSEDFGLGNYDASDGIYSNNAPDFSTIMQMSFTW